MKKTISIILIILIFLIIYFLQANFFSWFNIAGIKPNLFVVLVLVITLFAGIKVGLPTSFFLGLFLDLIIAKKVGISSVMLSIVSIIGMYLDKNFSKDSKFTIMLMVALNTFVFEAGSYFFSMIDAVTYIEILPFLKIVVIEIVFNMILTIILYPLIQFLGYKLEEIYKENNILTRYF